MNRKGGLKNPLDVAFKDAVPALGSVFFFSLCINLLMLTSPLYMLQVYDRVLVSRSVDTLVLLSAVALGALAVFGVLEAVRSRVLVRVGARFDQDVTDVIFDASMRSGSGATSFRDLEGVRTFLTGRSLLALFDAPWTPIYIALVYFLHPWLGHIAVSGAVLLFVIAFLNEATTRRPLRASAREIASAHQFLEAASRNRDTIQAMGMFSGLGRFWHSWHDSGLVLQALASDRNGIFSGAAKFIRVAVQISTLGVGAYLAINEMTSAGVMIAASIITGRALAPVEAAISGWRSMVRARESWTRLKEQLDAHFSCLDPMHLPAPKGRLVFENVFATPPGATRPTLSAVTFRLEPGVSVGLTGPSAAGKSSLARLMVGVWTPIAGEVRLDGAELSQWAPDLLGPHIGYLSQDVELFPGTVAQNIARFGDVDATAVVDAAELAGAHETILQLNDGYETLVGPGGANLSGGQRQRIGLARAFYGRPALIVLDEPTSNLDATGEASVRAAIDALKAAGSTVVVVAHRPSLLGGVDKMMVIQKGKLTHFGPTTEVMPQITRRPSSFVGSVEVAA